MAPQNPQDDRAHREMLDFYEGQYEKTFRSRPGLPANVRKATQPLAHQMMFCGVDPDVFGGMPEPPDHIKQQFSAVFGTREVVSNVRRLKLRMHPILKRWCLWELGRFNDNTQDAWWCIWVCSENAPHADFIPSDYKEHPALQHFAGLIGEYRMPEMSDFEMLDRFDRVKYTATEIENFQIEQENAITNAKESEFESFTHDFVSYYAHLAFDEANQRAGSMQKTWMTMEDLSERFRCNPEFYIIEQKDGYKVRRKRTHAEWEQWKRDLAKSALEAYKTASREGRAAIEDTFGMDKAAFRKGLGLRPVVADRPKLPPLPIPESMRRAIFEEWEKQRREEFTAQTEAKRKREVIKAAAIEVAVLEVKSGNG